MDQPSPTLILYVYPSNKHTHSVNSLAEILRQAIENEEKLLKEIVLPGTSLSIKEVCTCSILKVYTQDMYRLLYSLHTQHRVVC